MISRRSAGYLWEARQAADRITRFAAGRTFSDYLQDEMLRSAVERQFEVIGEALSGLRRTDPLLSAAIPELPRIIAFRNVLVHAYTKVNDEIVWQTVERDLDGLRATLERLLGQAEG